MLFEAMSQAKVTLFGVCSYGRSGTTLLMKSLRAVGVQVQGDVPFEDRTAQFLLAHWFRTRTSLHPRTQPMQASATFDGMTYQPGAIGAQMTGGSLDTQAEQLIQAIKKAGPVKFAEKFIGFGLLRAASAFDDDRMLKPVFLVRDPRNVFLSIKSFNARRGSLEFNDTGDDSLLYRTVLDFTRRQMLLHARIGGHWVRYEDMIEKPDRFLFDLARFVGVANLTCKAMDEAKQTLTEVSENEPAHITSRNAEESLNGWRSPEAMQKYRNIFALNSTLLNDIGYLQDA